jgi:hypothetical protein
MSLSQTLFKGVNDVIQSYVNTIAEKYNLNSDELISLWDESSLSKPKIPVKDSQKSLVDMSDVSIERLHKANKAELVALCKSRGYKCTGTKELLISRLLGKEEESKKEVEKKEVTKKEVTKKEVEKKEKDFKGKPDIIKKLIADIPCIPVRRNAHGNLEHPQTGLVFDRKTETVIGKQQDDGTVSELTDDDIEECKRFKFKYTIPSNLDKRDNLDNVKVEELESDVELQEEEEDVEEVEEDEEDEEEIEVEDSEEDA